MRRQAFALVLPAAFVVALLTGARAADWSVTQVSGEVWIGSPGVQLVSLGQGATLADGGSVVTGEDGRVLLRRGQEQIVVGPNSSITIPADDEEGFTTVLQRAGIVEFNVEKRGARHFEVETPYLAAVVKGTHFAVGAFAGSGVVKVARGRVEVSDPVSGQFVDVLPGQQAAITRNRGLSVTGAGKVQPLHQGQPFQTNPGLGLGRGVGLGLGLDRNGGLGLGLGNRNGLGPGNGNGLGLGLGLGLGNGNGNGNGNGHENGNGNGAT